jgi:hypothetical protein
LRRYFSRFGSVDSAQVLYNRETNKSRGFGFVVFDDDVAVDRVLAAGKCSRFHVDVCCPGCFTVLLAAFVRVVMWRSYYDFIAHVC